MFDLTPDPVAFRIGPIPVLWYGIAYAVGLAAVYLVVTSLAKRAGRNHELIGNGILVIAVAALIGGRLYHVIHEWDLYKDNLPAIVLPPYSGLGVYGGIITGTIAAWLYLRRVREPFWPWADIVAPGLFVMQAVGRLGNFFNQELYGPPTTLPWGIPIDCAHRVAAWPCETFPEATTRFHPLFLYESLSGLLGALFLVYLFVRHRHRLASGSLLFIFFIWYGAVRLLLEGFRTDNWVVLGVPMAVLVSIGFILVGFVGLLWRNAGRAGAAADRDVDDDDVEDDDADDAIDEGSEDDLDDAVDEDGADDSGRVTATGAEPAAHTERVTATGAEPAVDAEPAADAEPATDAETATGAPHPPAHRPKHS